MQAHLGFEQDVAGRDGHDDRQEEQHAQALQSVLPPGEGPAVEHLGPYQVHRGVHFAHDHLHQAHAKGGQGQAGHVLVGPEGDGEEAVEEARQ